MLKVSVGFRHEKKLSSGCLEGIGPSELKRKAREKVYHVKCFSSYSYKLDSVS